jgi:hypothetical protein
VHTERQKRFQNTLVPIQGDTKRVNQSTSQQGLSFHDHNTFSCILYASESKVKYKLNIPKTKNNPRKATYNLCFRSGLWLTSERRKK